MSEWVRGGTLREAEHAVEGRLLPRRGVPSLVQRMQVEAWCNECRLRVHPCYNHPTHQEPPQHTPTRERTPVERTPVPRRVLVGVQGPASVVCYCRSHSQLLGVNRVRHRAAGSSARPRFLEVHAESAGAIPDEHLGLPRQHEEPEGGVEANGAVPHVVLLRQHRQLVRREGRRSGVRVGHKVAPAKANHLSNPFIGEVSVCGSGAREASCLPRARLVASDPSDTLLHAWIAG